MRDYFIKSLRSEFITRMQFDELNILLEYIFSL